MSDKIRIIKFGAKNCTLPAVNREMKPRDNYRILLADVKFEIGKRQIGKDDKLALQELSEAKATYEELGLSNKTACVEEFMNSLD